MFVNHGAAAQGACLLRIPENQYSASGRRLNRPDVLKLGNLGAHDQFSWMVCKDMPCPLLEAAAA